MAPSASGSSPCRKWLRTRAALHARHASDHPVCPSGCKAHGKGEVGRGLRGGSTGGATRQTPRIPHGIKREERSRAPGIRPAKIAGLANLHPTLEKQRKGRLVW